MENKIYRRQVKEAFLFDTKVENLFISEYMVAAPGDFVKVYLTAMMLADLEEPVTHEGIARRLNIAEEEVLRAWTYWEGMGIIAKHHPDPEDRFRYEVELIPIRELVYGKIPKRRKGAGEEKRQAPLRLEDKAIRDMYATIERVTGRLLGGKEPEEIMAWITDFGATPEMIVYAYSYCIRTRKKDNPRYVGAVVREWAEKGLSDGEKIEKYLEEVDNRHYIYKRILKALGFLRNATEEERRLMDSWLDEMGFTLDKILEACSKTSGIPNPNMNYVNRILRNWHEGTGSKPEGESRKGGSVPSVFRYYDYLREEAERRAAERRSRIYEELPRIREIDEELRKHGMEVSRIMVSGAANASERIRDLKRRADRLGEEKAMILTDNNLDKDYLEVEYACSECRDTGTNDMGERCSCFSKRLSEVDEWQKKIKES